MSLVKDTLAVVSQAAKAEIGAKRILRIFALRRDRPRDGLMQHEFSKYFRSNEWRIADFKTAMQLAYDRGWVELDAQFYRLTKSGAAAQASFKRAARERSDDLSLDDSIAASCGTLLIG